jgi:hypothetical protein
MEVMPSLIFKTVHNGIPRTGNNRKGYLPIGAHPATYLQEILTKGLPQNRKTKPAVTAAYIISSPDLIR